MEKHCVSEGKKKPQVTAETRFKIMKWVGRCNGAENSRIVYSQETAERENKHRHKGDCKVEDRG